MSNENWKQHAYPLQQIMIQCQGTQHSDTASIIDQLETVLHRLRNGDIFGEEHDDDFGYRFKMSHSEDGPSFFDRVAGRK